MSDELPAGFVSRLDQFDAESIGLARMTMGFYKELIRTGATPEQANEYTLIKLKSDLGVVEQYITETHDDDED